MMETQDKFEFTRSGEHIEMTRTKQYEAEEHQLKEMERKFTELIDNYTIERTAISLAIKNKSKEVKVPLTNKYSLAQFIQAQTHTRNNVMQLKQQEHQLKNQIEQKMLQKQLLQTTEKLNETQSILDNNQEMEKEVRDELTLQIKKIVKKEKAKRGYGRIKDTKERLEVQNYILAPICTQMNLEMTDKLIINIKREFDKI